MASLAITYLLWLTLGLWGVHHIYLGRTSQAWLYATTLGVFGMGWIHDMWRIPQYVRQANGDARFLDDMKVRARSRPNTSIARSAAMFLLGYVLSYLALSPLGWIEPEQSLESPLASTFPSSFAALTGGAGIPAWWGILCLITSALGAAAGVMIVGSVGGLRTVNRHYVVLAALLGAAADAALADWGSSEDDAEFNMADFRALRVLCPVIVWIRCCEWVPGALYAPSHSPLHASSHGLAHTPMLAPRAAPPVDDDAPTGLSARPPSPITGTSPAPTSASPITPAGNASVAGAAVFTRAPPPAAAACACPRRVLTVVLGALLFWALAALYVYHYVPVTMDLMAGDTQDLPPFEADGARTYTPEEEAMMGYFGFDRRARILGAPPRVKHVLGNVLRSSFWRDFTVHLAAFRATWASEGFDRAWTDMVGEMDVSGEQWAWDALGLPPGSSLAAVRKAWRAGVLRWHPDKNRGNEEEAADRFREVHEAYAILERKARSGLLPLEDGDVVPVATEAAAAAKKKKAAAQETAAMEAATMEAAAQRAASVETGKATKDASNTDRGVHVVHVREGSEGEVVVVDVYMPEGDADDDDEEDEDEEDAGGDAEGEGEGEGEGGDAAAPGRGRSASPQASPAQAGPAQTGPASVQATPAGEDRRKDEL